jgi:hypothetical protein
VSPSRPDPRPDAASADGRGAGGKGRPTPKRKDRERRRTGPVAPPPLTRKEAAQRQKVQVKAARQKVRQGALSGDERYLPKRDSGPVRRLVRDVVDTRRNAGVLLLPIALFLVIASVLRNPVLMDIALTMWLAGLLMVMLDLGLLAASLRRRVRRDFPDEERTRGHIAYGLLRSTVFRRWRMPAPAVDVGDKV